MSTATLPIVCAWCERVRTSAGAWEEKEVEQTGDTATHGICPECLIAQTREAAATIACR